MIPDRPLVNFPHGANELASSVNLATINLVRDNLQFGGRTYPGLGRRDLVEAFLDLGRPKKARSRKCSTERTVSGSRPKSPQTRVARASAAFVTEVPGFSDEDNVGAVVVAAEDAEPAVSPRALVSKVVE
jgi:hypothetical protein